MLRKEESFQDRIQASAPARGEKAGGPREIGTKREKLPKVGQENADSKVPRGQPVCLYNKCAAEYKRYWLLGSNQ